MQGSRSFIAGVLSVCIALLPMSPNIALSQDRQPGNDSTHSEQVPDDRLLGKWYLATIDGKPQLPASDMWREPHMGAVTFLPPSDPPLPVSTFAITPTLYLSAGCNNGFNQHTLPTTGTIAFLKTLSTVRWCGGEVMTREARLFDGLTGVMSYTITTTPDTKRLLLIGSKGTFEFADHYPFKRIWLPAVGN